VQGTGNPWRNKIAISPSGSASKENEPDNIDDAVHENGDAREDSSLTADIRVYIAARKNLGLRIHCCVIEATMAPL
jgi:hypothetical protein